MLTKEPGALRVKFERENGDEWLANLGQAPR